jgi:putative transposase
VKMLFIEPGSPWENGYCGVFNSKLRDELLAGELFSTLYIERSRRPYNYHKTASPARLRPPVPETVLLSASPLACASPGQPRGWPPETGFSLNAWHRIEGRP